MVVVYVLSWGLGTGVGYYGWFLVSGLGDVAEGLGAVAGWYTHLHDVQIVMIKIYKYYKDRVIKNTLSLGFDQTS